MSKSNRYIQTYYRGKGTAICVQASTGPEQCRRLGVLDFKTTGTWRW